MPYSAISMFVGYYPSLDALQAAHPMGRPGDYAVIAVVGSPDSKYIWDVDDNDWVSSGAGSVWSVHGRIGNVVAQMGDYTAAQVGALTPAEVAAVAQAIESAGEKTMKVSVSTPDEMKLALDALIASPVYENAVITLTADISNNGGYNPSGDINKNIIFRSVGTRRVWTWGNGYNLQYTQTGKSVIFENVQLVRSGVTSTEGLRTQGANSNDRVWTRVVFSNCIVNSDSKVCHTSFWGYQTVYFIASRYSATGANGCLVKTSANSYHSESYGTVLHLIQSETTGTVANRGENPSIIEVHIQSSTVIDGGGYNAWHSANARHTTPPRGQFTVYVDEVSVVSRNVTPTSADRPDFVYNRSRANLIAPSNGDVMLHSGARSIHLVIPAAGGTANALTPVENGYYDGQRLSIIYSAQAGSQIWTIPNSGNMSLQGAFADNSVGASIVIQWDATAERWREVSRRASSGGNYSGRRSNGVGYSNTVSGMNGFASGSSNNISSDQSFAAGQSNSVYGNNSFALGMGNSVGASEAGAIGNNHIITSQMALATGSRAAAARYAQRAHSAGHRAATGDSQYMRDIVRVTITAGSSGDLLINAVHPLSILDNTVWAFRALVSARDTSGDAAGWLITGVIKRVTGVGSVSFVGTPSVTVLGKDDSSWDLTVTADTLNGTLKFTAIGDDTNETYFVGTIEATQVK